MPLLRGLPPQERPFPPTSPLPQGMSYAAFKISLKPNIFSESSLQEGIPPPEEERNDCSRFLFLEHLKHCSVLALKGPGFKGLSVSQQPVDGRPAHEGHSWNLRASAHTTFVNAGRSRHRGHTRESKPGSYTWLTSGRPARHAAQQASGQLYPGGQLARLTWQRGGDPCPEGGGPACLHAHLCCSSSCSFSSCLSDSRRFTCISWFMTLHCRSESLPFSTLTV